MTAFKPDPATLVIASRNPHKCAEIRTILAVPGLHTLSAADCPDLPDVEEDGDTFNANALKKAVTIAHLTGCWALGDDSGLEVDALHGAPGVHSARYAGEPADTAANNRKLLAALKGVSNRRARFRCVLALASPAGKTWLAEGTCEGRIATEEHGRHGFGYDPLFIPEGHSETFACMTPARKHALSHRGQALATAQRTWAALFQALVTAQPTEVDNIRKIAGFSSLIEDV